MEVDIGDPDANDCKELAPSQRTQTDFDYPIRNEVPEFFYGEST